MTERVLLSIEDSDAEFFIIKMALKEARLRVHLCRVPDGDEALSFLRGADKYQGAPKPNLIFLNLNLPKKNGLEVLEDIRQIDQFVNTPVVIFTTSSDHSDRMRALKMGAQEFITKPATLDGLIETISGVCSRLL